MKSSLKSFVFSLAFVFVAVSFFASAPSAFAAFVVTEVSPAVFTANTSIKPTFKAVGQAPETVKFYVWAGEYNPVNSYFLGTPSQSMVTVITPTSPDPSTFDYTINFGASGMIPNKTYAYALSNASGGNFYDGSLGTAIKCFTTTAGPVTCPTGTGGPAPVLIPGPQPGGITVTLTATGQDPSDDFPGKYIEHFKILPLTPLSESINAILAVTTAADPNTSLVNVPIVIPAGNVAVFPSVDGLVPDYYMAGVYTTSPATGNGLLSDMVPFSVTLVVAPPGGPGAPSGPGTPANPAVNGACGQADGSTTLTAPSANLCSAGNASNMQGGQTGPWSWVCLGINGGTSSVPCTAQPGNDDDFGENFLQNPLAAGLDTFPEILAAVYNNIILPIAVPFLVIFIIYSGFLFVMARKDGNTFSLIRAQETFKYTMIGAALILGGWLIANAIQGTINSLLG